MALIIDPDDLNDATEVDIDTGNREIDLNLAGNLSEDGVTLQALFSFLKEEWKNVAANIPHPFPMIAITSEQFEWVEGWTPFDDAARKLIRVGGWKEIDETDTLNEEWLGVITLGTIDFSTKTSGDIAYYFFAGDAAKTDFTYAGPVDEAVQTFGDTDHGNFDERSSVLTVVIRQQAKIYDIITTTDIGVTIMTNKVERFPLQESGDLKIVVSDVGIDADSNGTADVAPYDNMSITYVPHQNQGGWLIATGYGALDVVQDHESPARWFITAAGGTSGGDDSDLSGGSDTGITWVSFVDGERLIGAIYYAFGVIIDGNDAVAENIYEFVQWSLRQTVDIDAGSGNQVGFLAQPLLVFIGDTLRTLLQPGTVHGVFIDSFDSNDTNRLEFQDDLFTTVNLTFPFVAAGTIFFNTNLQNDAGSPQFRMFFEYTSRETVADLAFSGVSTNTASMDSAGTNLPTLAQNDYINVLGATNAENNGIWQVTDASPTTTQADVSKWDTAVVVVAETAFAGTIDINPISSPDFIIVDDNGGSDISGTISGPSVSFDFDYDGNNQGGRTPGEDAVILLKAIGLETAAYVETSGIITQAVGLAFTLVAPLERVYVNP